MLTVWGRADSSNVQALMWCLAELGLESTRIDAGHRFGVTDTPEFIAMNPNRTVPVLRDGDGPALWETGAILRYVAARYAPDSFWPADPVARADIDRWAEWAKLNFALAFSAQLFRRIVFTPASARQPERIRKSTAALEKTMAIAEDRLTQHEFLVGDCLTLADIHMGHNLYRYYTLDIPRGSLPGIRAYYDRLCARPAYAEHVMVSYEDLRAG